MFPECLPGLISLGADSQKLSDPRPEDDGAGPRLQLDVDQGHQVGHARAGRWRVRSQPQPGHQVELPLLSLRRCQEQLLVQPVDVDELEPRRPVGEEAEKASKNSFSSTLRR